MIATPAAEMIDRQVLGQIAYPWLETTSQRTGLPPLKLLEILGSRRVLDYDWRAADALTKAAAAVDQWLAVRAKIDAVAARLFPI